jgi:type II secretory pathway pseudopilin PulG
MGTTPARRRVGEGRVGEGGFTLVETVIAMAILFGALVMALDKIAANVHATNKAKLLSAAIGLARGKMLDLEEELLQKGFQETAESFEGDFSDEGFPAYAWKAKVEKVEMPALGQLQTAQGKSGEGESPGSGLIGLAGAGGGNATQAAGAATISSQFEMIANVLKLGIRKVTLDVQWKVGRKEDKFTVVAYFTDPKAVDQAMAGINAFAGGAGGAAPGGAPSGGGGGR